MIIQYDTKPKLMTGRKSEKKFSFMVVIFDGIFFKDEIKKNVHKPTLYMTLPQHIQNNERKKKEYASDKTDLI